MIVSGLSAAAVESIVRSVSAHEYGGNVVVESIADKSSSRTPRCSVKIGTLDSRAHGSRTTASGRHGRYASWQAFRDILAAIFDQNPAATVRTGIATYKGRDGFEQTFPGTYYRNAGSLYSPAFFGDLSV